MLPDSELFSVSLLLVQQASAGVLQMHNKIFSLFSIFTDLLHWTVHLETSGFTYRHVHQCGLGSASVKPFWSAPQPEVCAKGPFPLKATGERVTEWLGGTWWPAKVNQPPCDTLIPQKTIVTLHNQKI